jgi:hypothetical protein
MTRMPRRSAASDRLRGVRRLAVVSAGIGLGLLLLGIFLPREAPLTSADRTAGAGAAVVPDVAVEPKLTVPPSSATSALPSTSDTAGLEPQADRGVEPTYLDITRIGVHTEVISLGLNADGTVMVPPPDPGGPVGWYRYLATPGEPGTAVLLGHLDSYQGPAVFYRLSAPLIGDRISVARSDGTTAVFTVQSVQACPKSPFPSEAAYGSTAAPVLRLITCGGRFDRVHRTYLSNVVVYAELAS